MTPAPRAPQGDGLGEPRAPAAARIARAAACGAVAAAAHAAAAFAAIVAAPLLGARAAGSAPVEITVVDRPEPPPPEPETPPEPEVPPPEPEPPRPPARPPPRAEVPPPEPETPPEPEVPPPEILNAGITLEGTAGDSSWSMPVGNTPYGTPDRVVDPDKLAPYGKPPPLPPPPPPRAPPRVVRPPRPIGDVQPPYPPEARRRGVEGEVVCFITVEADGTVGDVQVESAPDPDLQAAAVEALRESLWEPARLSDGRPTRRRHRVRFRFRLDW